MLLFHTLLVRRAIAIDALPILVFSSLSKERLLEMVEPRYIKSSTVSRVWWPMEMQGVLLTSWPMTFDGWRHHLLTDWRRGAAAGRKRCRRASGREHSLASHRFGSGKLLNISHHTGRYLSFYHGRTWPSSEAWGDIRSCAVGWRGLSCWPSQRPWSGRWRRCRVAVSAPGTSPAAVWVRRSYRSLISGIWSRTAPLDRRVQPALWVCTAPHGRRPSPQYSARRCRDSCYNHCGHLCSCRVWWC